MKGNIFILVYWMIFAQGTFAQQDSIWAIPGDTIEYVVDALTTSEDLVKSQTTNAPVFQTLQHLTTINIRSNGPGLLSTGISRGLASRHLGIFWGGFSINSVVNGTTDLSILATPPGGLRYIKNTASSIAGNSTPGGIVNLTAGMPKITEMALSHNISNIKNNATTLLANFHRSLHSHSIVFTRQNHQNHYRYYDAHQINTQKRASANLTNIHYINDIQLSKAIDLKSGYWYIHSHRNIPPTKGSAPVPQVQNDNAHRVFASITHHWGDAARLSLRAAYFDDQLIYQSGSIYSEANSKAYNFALEGVNYRGFTTGIQYRHDIVNASFFSDPKQRKTISTFLQYQWKNDNNHIIASLRPENVDNKWAPITFNLDFTHHFDDTWFIESTISKNYTLPSFNDLYWPQGGNSALKTEKSITADITLSHRVNRFKGEVTLYGASIDNWIQWIPTSSGYWSPANQKKVNNLGVEIHISQSFKLPHSIGVESRIIFEYTDSRIADHYTEPALIGKKNIFVPLYKVSLPIRINYYSWTLNAYPVINGPHYRTTDNRLKTPGYFIIDAHVEGEVFEFDKFSGILSFYVNNITNVDYEVIKAYPMPLRYFGMGIILKYKPLINHSSKNI